MGKSTAATRTASLKCYHRRRAEINRARSLKCYHRRRAEINRARNKPLDYWFRKAVAGGEKIYQQRRGELQEAAQRVVALRGEREKQFQRSRILKALRRRLQAAFRYGTSYSKMARELLGCGIPEFKKHIESLWKPGMSWENYGYMGWHFDHRVPCASFDLTDFEQQKRCFHWSNFQPLWAKENFDKGAR